MTLAPAMVAPCPHCGTPVEGPEGTFCCHGCETAAQILEGVGLEGWYVTRQQAAPRATTAGDVAWDRVPVQVHEDGSVSACLAVDGFRCASCVWVTEKMLERTPGVQDAHVSYATGRATLTWNPDATELATLAGRIASLGYAPRPGHDGGTHDRDLLVRLGVATFGAMNVMGLYAPLYAGWVDGMSDAWAQLFRWAALAMATPIVTYAAVPFYRGAVQGLRHRLLHMDLPIALAITAMYAHGFWATVSHEDAFLDSMGMLVALLLAGRVLEARGRKRASDAAASLAAVVPRTARRVLGDAVETVATQDLAVGDHIELGSGEEIPADGVVVSGEGLVRMAVVTGESRPQAVTPGDSVVAGGVVQDGALRVGVTRTGDRTLVEQMAADLMAAGDAPRDPTAADRLAPAFTAITLMVAAITGVWVGTTMGQAEALSRVVAVLVVACPCALALAAPMVGASGLGATARRGLLVRGGDTLERCAAVDTVVLDKTGTVTWGRPVVLEADDDILRVAAALERYSRHPVATAILEAAVRRGIPIPVPTDVHEVAGVGIDGRVDGEAWTIRRGDADRVCVSSSRGVTGWIRLEDRPRTGALDDIRALQRAGLEVVLLSGDHPDVASRIGSHVGITRVLGGVGPLDKVQHIQQLQAQGHVVMFVGDGLNDGPALGAADVGVAMAHGAASSVLAADALLAGDRLAPLLAGVVAGPVVKRRVRANLVRSATYNLVAVGAATLGYVNPLVAALLMPLSSGLVIASAMGVERAVARAFTAET